MHIVVKHRREDTIAYRPQPVSMLYINQEEYSCLCKVIRKKKKKEKGMRVQWRWCLIYKA